MTSRLSNAVAVAGLLFASSLAAQTTFPPREHAQGAVSYISGGVSEDESQAMRAAAADYPLTLELAAPSGGPKDEYIAGAKVEILDRQGNPVLNTMTEGPFLLVRLPAGTYTVAVAWNGAAKSKTVEIDAGKRQHVMLEFPREHGPQ
jgi:hypothetical protein